MPVYLPLLRPARYKGAHGGRGSGKSHNFAEMLIERCLMYPTRAVCLREIQLSLKRSSKLLIEDKIKQLGVSNEFKVLSDSILCPDDGFISFHGMQNHTSDSIKSFEGFDIAWFEEAHMMSEYSFGLLRPTLRKDDSEYWFSWNPNFAKDPIDKFLRSTKRPENSIVVEANFRDNKLFPKVLKDEMEYDKRRDPDRYAHVWLGGYRRSSLARVFNNWRIEEFETPADARFYFGADWGFASDPTVLVRCWIKDRTLFIDYEAWKIGCEIDYTPALFAGSDTRSPARWENPQGYVGIPGALKWPLIADSANPQTISYMRRKGFDNIRPSIKGIGSIEEGIEFLKSFDIVVHPRCEHVIDELTNFEWKIDKKTEEVLPILGDKKNHVIDSLRYGVEPLRRPKVQSAVFATYGQHSR